MRRLRRFRRLLDAMRFAWLAFRMYRLGGRCDTWEHPSRTGAYTAYSISHWRKGQDWRDKDADYWKVSSGGTTYSDRFPGPLEAARDVGAYPCQFDAAEDPGLRRR